MKKYLILLLTAVAISCSVVRPIKEETVVHHLDSIAWHDSTIYHHIPVEVIKTITLPGDTSHLETTIATSDAWTDTLGLHHTLKNKNTALKTEIKWKEKIVYRDSVKTVTKEVPYEVIKEVVPEWSWWLLGWSILTFVYCFYRIWRFFGK